MAVTRGDWLDFRAVSAFIGRPHSNGGSRHPILSDRSFSLSPYSLSLSLSLSRPAPCVSFRRERSFSLVHRVPLQAANLPSRRAPTLLFLSFSFSLGTARSPYVTDTIPLE